jgi:hypothetical protein
MQRGKHCLVSPRKFREMSIRRLLRRFDPYWKMRNVVISGSTGNWFRRTIFPSRHGRAERANPQRRSGQDRRHPVRGRQRPLLAQPPPILTQSDKRFILTDSLRPS